jgi:hypothetical protein
MSQLFENYYNDNTVTIENKKVHFEEEKEEQEISVSNNNKENEEFMYVISIDDKPYFYQTSFADAKDKLLDISKRLNNKINENEYYDSYICQKLEDEITIVNQLDFVLFTKNHLLHTLKIHTVKKY